MAGRQAGAHTTPTAPVGLFRNYTAMPMEGSVDLLADQARRCVLLPVS
jgi:hypothetical protein